MEPFPPFRDWMAESGEVIWSEAYRRNYTDFTCLGGYILRLAEEDWEEVFRIYTSNDLAPNFKVCYLLCWQQ